MVRQFTLLVLAALSIGIVVSILYMRPPQYVTTSVPTKTLVAAGLDLPALQNNEEFVSFLAQRFGAYGSLVEIVQIVILSTKDITGKDYVLLTLRAPNGKYYQTVISRDAYPWSRWSFDPQTFAEADQIQLDLSRPIIIEDIIPKEVLTYYQLNSVAQIDQEPPDEQNKNENVPARRPAVSDIKKAGEVGQPAMFKLELGKDKKWRFNSIPKDTAGETNTYWKVDYPAEYSGGGYRIYLYKKIKGQ